MNQTLSPIKVFISPRPSPESNNVYIAKLTQSLSQRMVVLNAEPGNPGRSIDLLRHVFKADVFLLNWSEDTLSLRFGLLQAFLFNLGVLLAKLRGRTILWVCHNRKTHHKKNQHLNEWNRKFFKKVADKILVHSEDAKEHLKDVAAKVVYVPHPRYDKISIKPSSERLSASKPQVLIWGSISPYKGLETFIEQYKLQEQNFHTLIIGKAKNDYHDKLTTLAAGTNIRVENAFVDDNDLVSLFEETKIVLLPYLQSDTFSSGALIHSLNSGKVVIGPQVGNFLDLEKEAACITYKDYGTLFSQLSELLNDESFYTETLARLQRGMHQYYVNNSWADFVDGLETLIQTKTFFGRKHHSTAGLQNANKIIKQPT